MKLRALGLSAAVVVALIPGVSSAKAPEGSAPPVDVSVILPAGYGPGRPYPVLFMLNSVHDSCQPACGEITQRLAALPVITVLENRVTALSDYVDWNDGSVHGEQQMLDTVHWVDSTYNTSRRREDRVIAGISAGGYGAVLLAAHHPELFGAVASLSGPLDIRGAADENEGAFAVTSVPPPVDPGTGATSTIPPDAVYGRPLVDDDRWAAGNPSDLVSHLAETDVYHSTGTGVPCSEADAPFVSVEPLVYKTNQRFEQLAAAAGVHSTYVVHDCGVHSYDYFLAEFREWVETHLRLGARPGRRDETESMRG